MNNRKYLIVLLLGVFSVILIYNFFIIQYFQSNTMNMMDINRSVWNSPVFFIDVQCLIIVGALLIALLLLEGIRSRSDKNVCSQCGKRIENSRWKVCPVCGTIVNAKAGV